MKSYGQSVQVPKAAELVASAIRRQIVRGTIHDGEALPPETELMSQFGVSRPTLREALRVLESEKLISVRRGARGGATAHRMTGEIVSRHAGLLLQSRGTTLSDVYEAQITFEPACVRQLAFDRTDDDLAVLRRTLAEEQAATKPVDDARARVHFHGTLVELYGNQTLILLSELIADVLNQAAGEAPIGLDHDRAVRDHMTVVDLIEARDGDGAHDLWRTHLQDARQKVLKSKGADKRVVDLLD
jgi:DNA-binding FadR family transcriptional regulator